MKTKKFPDRRKSARMKVENTWGEGRQGILPALGLGKRFKVKILDLSQSGMRVVACHPLPVHQRYKFIVRGGKGGDMAMRGRIVWSTHVQQEKGDAALYGSLAGVEFPSIRPEQKSFLCDLAVRRRPKEARYKQG